MTIEEFNNTSFGADMTMRHIPTGREYDILTVDFEEALIGIDDDCDICDHCGYAVELIQWFRCENCEIIYPYRQDNVGQK